LNVTPQNDAPTLSDLPDISTSEDTPVSIGNISIADLESTLTCAASLSVVSSTNADLLPINVANISFDENPPSSGKCRMTLTPAANQHGTSTITVQVTDNSLPVTKTFTLTVNSVNDAPQLQNFSTTSKSMPEDPQTEDQTITFNLADDTNSISCGTAVTSSANNSTLLPLGSLVVTGGTLNVTNGVATTACTLTITPAENQHGSAIITLNVADGAGGTSAATVNLTVNSQNDAPTIAISTPVPPQPTVPEDTPYIFNLNVNDTDGALSCTSEHLQGTDANAGNLVQTVNFSGTWPNCAASVVPKANVVGSTTVTFTVDDKVAPPVPASVGLEITSVDDSPTITLGFASPQAMNEDTTRNDFSITINDVDTAVTCADLNNNVTSSNQVLILNAGITITESSGQTGNTRTCSLGFTPQANRFGSTTITLTLPFGANPVTNSFILNVTDIPDAPVLAGNPPLTLSTVQGSPVALSTNEDVQLTISNLSLTDSDSQVTCSDSLSLVSSSRTDLISLTGASFSNDPDNTGKCRIIITPTSNITGSSNLQIRATDGSNSTDYYFIINVTPEEDDPTIGSIAAQIMSEDPQAQFEINFTVGDPDGYLDNLNQPFSCSTYLMALSHDQTKVATPSGVQFVGSFPNCTARIAPVLNANTQTPMQITFVVTDPTQRTASRTFSLTITPANDAPVINVSTLPTFTEDQNPVPVVNFTIADVDAASGFLPCNSATAVDSDAANDFSTAKLSSVVIANGANPNSCIATVNLVQNANGAANFTLRVNDSGNGGGSSLTDEEAVAFTISAVNDAPTGAVTCNDFGSNVFRTSISDGSNWTIEGCTGATDVDGDSLVYRLELQTDNPQASKSESFDCPPTVSSTAGATSITGAFASAGNFGSCRYKLKACDTSNACTIQSENSVIVSSYELSVGAPSKPTISNTCVVSSSSNITFSGNISAVVTEAHTNAPGAVATQPPTITSSPSTATFTTDITTRLLDAIFITAIPTKETNTTAVKSKIKVTEASLNGAGFNPLASDLATNDIFSAATYSIKRTLELLAVRKGGTSGAASALEEMHSDGQQPSFVSSTGCRACTNGAFVSISAGDTHTCLTETTGTTKCWGNSADGRLGIGSNPSLYTMTPTGIDTSAAGTFTHTQIAAGKQFTCLLGTGTQGVKCWGGNEFFQLGRGGTSTTQLDTPDATVVQKSPVPLSDLNNAVSIAASKTGSHACAVTSAGNVYCWGAGTSGQLGDGLSTDSSSAVQVLQNGGATALPSVRSIAAGGLHSCAALAFKADNQNVTESGIYCWGENGSGQLGDGTIVDSSKAVPIAVIDQVEPIAPNATDSQWFTQVVAGAAHTCALRSDGAVFCWGLNSRGQVGDGTTANSTRPVSVSGIGGTGSLSDVVAISAGKNHTCALKNDHAVLCWGANESGQLGDGTIIDRTTPVEIIAGATSNTVAISAGGAHTCVANFNGTVQCWGEGLRGQLGNNTLTSSTSPVLVNWTAGVTANANLRPRTCSVYTIP